MPTHLQGEAATSVELHLGKLWAILELLDTQRKGGNKMYTSTITVPRVTETTLAQLEKVAPGIVALHGLKVTETVAAAVEISSETLLPKLHHRESIGEVDAVETSTGWIVTTEILEFGR